MMSSGAPVKAGVNLGTRDSFADLGATIAELLGIEPLPHGTEFVSEIMRTE